MDDIVTVTGSQLMVVTQDGSSKGHFKGLCPPYGRQIADDDDDICRRVLRKIRVRSVCRLHSQPHYVTSVVSSNFWFNYMLVS